MGCLPSRRRAAIRWPCPRGPDAEVLQAAGDEAPRLVVAKARENEVGSRVVDLEQLVLVGGEAEEVVLLLDPVGRTVVDRTLAVHEFILVLERLAVDAVPAGIDVLIDVAVVVDALEEGSDEGRALIARPDEEVIRDVEALGQFPPDDAICRRIPGSSPCERATLATLVACSSTPVRKKVSSPRWR